MPQLPNSNDAHLATLDLMPVKFAFDDALAFLGNTRTQFSGSDYVDSALHSLQTWPGLPDVAGLVAHKNAVNAGAVQGATVTQGKSGATYDCATGKCSDGSRPHGDFLKSWLACKGIGVDPNSLCQTPPIDLDPQSPTFGVNPGAVKDYFLGSDWMKRGAFILFALILIGIALYKLIGGGTIIKAAEAA